jgi:uncharacterized membrane-anchored protein
MKKINFSIVFLLVFFLSLTVSQAQADKFSELKWVSAPAVGKVGGKAEFKVTGSSVFLDPIETDKFLQLNGNLPTKDAYTIANEKSDWFGILQVVEEGYVKDDEKIDADALIKSLKEENNIENEKKKEKGMPSLILDGWYFPPRYDTENKRLEWGTKLRSPSDNSFTVNVTTKILGKSGYTSAILVSSPETLDKDLIEFKATLKNFDYVSGEKYSEWKQGDKVAAYGLGALVLGGAAAAATKKGGLKLIWIAILGAGAALWAGFKKFFAKK